MYLAAQQVVSTTTNAVGINAYRYVHNRAVPDIANASALEQFLQNDPGILATSSTDVPPGGNPVLRYLDVVAPDDATADEVSAAVADFCTTWTPEHTDLFSRGRVRARYYAGTGDAAEARGRLEALARRIDLLLRSPIEPWEAAEPLTVQVTTGPNERAFEIDVAALARLRAVHGARWRPPRISARHDGTADFGRDADVYFNLAPILTGLGTDGLLRLGGVCFVDASTGSTLWRWPASGTLTGHCLRCRQRGTLRALASESGFECASCGNVQQTDGVWVATLT